MSLYRLDVEINYAKFDIPHVARVLSPPNRRFDMRTRRFLAALATVTLFTPCLAVAQDIPNNLRDLIGARAAGGENQLMSRGFEHIKTQQGADRLWANWWNDSRRECITVVVMNGRYDSIVTSPPADCNQSNASSNNTAAAAVLGAAAILGIAALAHKSDHHDDRRHYDNDRDEAAYERGFRDGLYNHSYDSSERRGAYATGYSAGVSQRRHESSYRPEYHPNRH